MTDKVIKTILEHQMIFKGDTVGVGLSGGADSVALFSILANNKDLLGIEKLVGIHIHHGIRGDEADRDLEFSKKLCEKFNTKCVYYYVNVPAEAQKSGESIEECARRIRYDCFLQSGLDKIATAHNLNDNMETVIFNLSRGSSLNGLCGIPYIRDNKFIRPMLNCTRAEIEDYLKENSLDFVTDSTNLCDDYTRNKIRHNILPQLFELNPAFPQAFANCNNSLRLTNDFVMQTANDYLEKSRTHKGYDCKIFENCHLALKNQIISLILKEQNAKNISRKHIDAVLNIIENNGEANLCGNVTARVHNKILYFGKEEITEYFNIKIEKTSSQVKTPVGMVKIDLLLKNSLQIFNKEDMDFLIDYDKIHGELVVRNRAEGDEFHPINRVNKKLKKLFNEEKIPVTEREKMIILSDDNGIVWTEFFGTSHSCRVTKDTVKCIKISVVGE